LIADIVIAPVVAVVQILVIAVVAVINVFLLAAYTKLLEENIADKL